MFKIVHLKELFYGKIQIRERKVSRREQEEQCDVYKRWNEGPSTWWKIPIWVWGKFIAAVIATPGNVLHNFVEGIRMLYVFNALCMIYVMKKWLGRQFARFQKKTFQSLRQHVTLNVVTAKNRRIPYKEAGNKWSEYWEYRKSEESHILHMLSKWILIVSWIL